jgi:uncharacterized membrane protein YgcG
MADLTASPRLLEALDPIANGLRGFRKPDVVRAGLVAGGLAFSVALLLASIQHPTTAIHLLDPAPGLSRGDSTERASSDLSGLQFGAASSLATALIDSFENSSNHQVPGVRQFLDFVQSNFPSIALPDSSDVPKQVPSIFGAAAVTPQLAFAPEERPEAPVVGLGGGGGEIGGIALGPISGLPPWWAIWAWIDASPAIVTPPASESSAPTSTLVGPAPVTPAPVAPPLISPASNLPPAAPAPVVLPPVLSALVAPPPVAPPTVAPPTVTSAQVSPPPVAPAPVSAPPVAPAPVNPPSVAPAAAVSPSPTSPPQPASPPADEQLTAAEPAGRSQGGSAGNSGGKSTASSGGGSVAKSGTSASSSGASGPGSTEQTKPNGTPKKPAVDHTPPKKGSVGGGSGSGTAGSSDGSGSGSGEGN